MQTVNFKKIGRVSILKRLALFLTLSFLILTFIIPNLLVHAASSEFTEVWKDDFVAGENLSTNWNLIDEGGGFGNQELEHYLPRNATLVTKDGYSCLALTAKRENYGIEKYTSAKLTTDGKRLFKYGRMEMRAKLPGKVTGSWPAFWMMPSDMNLYTGWPKCGEIDIMECPVRNTTTDPSKYYGTIHYGDPWTHHGYDYTLPSGTYGSDWHTFAVEWLPNSISWYMDDICLGTLNDWFSRAKYQAADFTYGAPFDREFYAILNFAVGGSWPGDPNSTESSYSDYDGPNYPTYYIDYVKYSQYNGVMPAEWVRPTPVGIGTGPGTPPQADGNYVHNGDFGTGDISNWSFSLTDGAVGTAQVNNGAIQIASTNAGTQNWSVQLYQDGN